MSKHKNNFLQTDRIFQNNVSNLGQLILEIGLIIIICLLFTEAKVLNHKDKCLKYIQIM